MKQARTIMAAAIALMLAACNVESDFLSPKKNLYTETITVSANRNGVGVNSDRGTRAVLTEENTLKSVWEEGDQLTIWTGSEFSEDNMSEGGFTLDSGASTNSATFTGKVKSTSKPNKNTVLTAVVDTEDDMLDCSSGTTAALDFSEQESCTTSTVLRYDALWAQATYANRDFHFAHTMSFVEWTIKINGITAATTCDIILSATGMQNKASLDLAEGKLTGTNAGDIKLKGISIDASGLAVVYLALFPGHVTSKMSAVVTMANGKVMTGQLGTFEEFTFVANNLYTAAWTFSEPVVPAYTLTATSPGSIAYNATSTGNYTVKSYVTIGSTKQPVAWEVTKYEYSDDNGATWTDNGTVKPSWLSALSRESGSGSIDGENGRATVKAAGIVTGNPVNSILKNAAPKNNYDLSQGGETANCYVVSAPGTYRIPLIYGNARNADGSQNSDCFNNTSPYVNYNGTAITNMWLKTDGTPSTGSLVWKDVTTDIVTNLAVSSDKNFLTFTVSQSAIKQGNAVVAVKDNSGKIMWSWHLWFTDSGALSTIPFNNADGETQYFSRDNLGYTYDNYKGTPYTAPRRVRVTVTQTGSNQTARFQIIQEPYSEMNYNDFHSTMYQFGRKDAFSGLTTGAPTVAPGKTTYRNSILNPGTFYTTLDNDEEWRDNFYTNAWAVHYYTSGVYIPELSVNVSTRSVWKSVYDPCPAGFKMPGSNAFTGFSKSNSTWDSGRGYTFTDNSNGTSVFLPVVGYRKHTDGELTNNSTSSNYWSAIQRSEKTAWDIYFDEEEVVPQSFSVKGSGRCVRPVRDK